MKYFRNLVILHRWAILVTFLIGLIFILPQTLSRLAIGDLYKGAPFLSQNDDETYLTNIQEIIDGHWLVSSPIFSGYKDSKTYILPIGEYLYALPHILTGIPVLLMVTILSKFVFPASLFLLVYILIYSLSQNGGEEKYTKLNAIAGGLLVVLGYDFADPRYIFSSLSGKTGAVYASMWARLVNPITGSLFLMSYLILLWRSIKGNSRWLLSLISGVILALSAGYFFSYATGLAVTGVLFIIILLGRNNSCAKRIGMTMAIGVIPLLIQLSHVLLSGLLDGESSSLSKLGLFYTHSPLINTLLLVALVIFVFLMFLFYKKTTEENQNERWWWQFSLAILIGLALAFNQQIITGLTIWPQHFVQYSIPLIYIVAIVVFYKIVLPWSKKLWFFGIMLIFLCTISWGLWMSFQYQSRLEEYLNSQRYMKAFEWLQKETQDECVVFAIEDTYVLSNKITAYTHCDVYYSMNTLYGVPQERIEHGYLSWLTFRGVRAENIDGYLKENKEEVYTTTFTNWMEKFKGSNYEWLDSIGDEGALDQWEGNSIIHLADAYRAFRKKDFKTELHKYRLDYVLWDKRRYPKWDPKIFPFLELVYTLDEISIFKVIM